MLARRQCHHFIVGLEFWAQMDGTNKNSENQEKCASKECAEDPVAKAGVEATTTPAAQGTLKELQAAENQKITKEVPESTWLGWAGSKISALNPFGSQSEKAQTEAAKDPSGDPAKAEKGRAAAGDPVKASVGDAAKSTKADPSKVEAPASAKETTKSLASEDAKTAKIDEAESASSGIFSSRNVHSIYRNWFGSGDTAAPEAPEKLVEGKPAQEGKLKASELLSYDAQMKASPENAQKIINELASKLGKEGLQELKQVSQNNDFSSITRLPEAEYKQAIKAMNPEQFARYEQYERSVKEGDFALKLRDPLDADQWLKNASVTDRNAYAQKVLEMSKEDSDKWFAKHGDYRAASQAFFGYFKGQDNETRQKWWDKVGTDEKGLKQRDALLHFPYAKQVSWAQGFDYAPKADAGAKTAAFQGRQKEEVQRRESEQQKEREAERKVAELEQASKAREAEQALRAREAEQAQKAKAELELAQKTKEAEQEQASGATIGSAETSEKAELANLELLEIKTAEKPAEPAAKSESETQQTETPGTEHATTQQSELPTAKRENRETQSSAAASGSVSSAEKERTSTNERSSLPRADKKDPELKTEPADTITGASSTSSAGSERVILKVDGEKQLDWGAADATKEGVGAARNFMAQFERKLSQAKMGKEVCDEANKQQCEIVQAAKPSETILTSTDPLVNQYDRTTALLMQKNVKDNVEGKTTKANGPTTVAQSLWLDNAITAERSEAIAKENGLKIGDSQTPAEKSDKLKMIEATVGSRVKEVDATVELSAKVKSDAERSPEVKELAAKTTPMEKAISIYAAAKEKAVETTTFLTNVVDAVVKRHEDRAREAGAAGSPAKIDTVAMAREATEKGKEFFKAYDAAKASGVWDSKNTDEKVRYVSEALFGKDSRARQEFERTTQTALTQRAAEIQQYRAAAAVSKESESKSTGTSIPTPEQKVTTVPNVTHKPTAEGNKGEATLDPKTGELKSTAPKSAPISQLASEVKGSTDPTTILPLKTSTPGGPELVQRLSIPSAQLEKETAHSERARPSEKVEAEKKDRSEPDPLQVYIAPATKSGAVINGRAGESHLSPLSESLQRSNISADLLKGATNPTSLHGNALTSGLKGNEVASTEKPARGEGVVSERLPSDRLTAAPDSQKRIERLTELARQAEVISIKELGRNEVGIHRILGPGELAKNEQGIIRSLEQKNATGIEVAGPKRPAPGADEFRVVPTVIEPGIRGKGPKTWTDILEETNTKGGSIQGGSLTPTNKDEPGSGSSTTVMPDPSQTGITIQPVTLPGVVIVDPNNVAGTHIAGGSTSSVQTDPTALIVISGSSNAGSHVSVSNTYSQSETQYIVPIQPSPATVSVILSSNQSENQTGSNVKYISDSLSPTAVHPDYIVIPLKNIVHAICPNFTETAPSQQQVESAIARHLADDYTNHSGSNGAQTWLPSPGPEDCSPLAAHVSAAQVAHEMEMLQALAEQTQDSPSPQFHTQRAECIEQLEPKENHNPHEFTQNFIAEISKLDEQTPKYLETTNLILSEIRDGSLSFDSWISLSASFAEIASGEDAIDDPMAFFLSQQESQRIADELEASANEAEWSRLELLKRAQQQEKERLEREEKKQEDEERRIAEAQRYSAALLAALKARQAQDIAARIRAQKELSEDQLTQRKTRKTYIVRKGDSLESIAQKLLMDKRLAPLILELNKTRLTVRIEGGRRVVDLAPNTVLVLPNSIEAQKFIAVQNSNKFELFSKFLETRIDQRRARPNTQRRAP